MNQEDFDRLEDRGARCGELLAQRGVKALQIAHAWLGSTRAATLEPSASAIPETFYELVAGVWVEHLAFKPNDPTGEADSTTVDQLRHARLVAAIGAWDTATSTLTNLLLETVPRAPDAPRENDCPDGACTNCWLDNRYFEPSRAKGLCRWCGEFKAAERVLPPLRLLRWRHEGRRITKAEVDRVLGRKAKTA